MENNLKSYFNEIESCWCYFCSKLIKKREQRLTLYKIAWKGTTRNNICLVCLNDLNKEINKSELRKLKLARIEQGI